VTLGVAAGLVVGKAIGICGTALVVGRLVRSPLLRALAVPDWIGVALVGGVGFTVSLLIGQLAFAGDATRAADAQIGVVTGSVLAAVLAAVVLGARNRHYATLNRQRASAQQRDRASDRSGETQTVMPD
jgi:NhaA family Na+:H+ antiporter